MSHQLRPGNSKTGRNPNCEQTVDPSIKNNKLNKNTKEQQFEFCEVCKLNHNQGRRHIYFPNHKKSLAALLRRFQSKLSDVRFFLKNPILLRPEHASQNRVWCIFCDCDLVELNGRFACGNAIEHLASVEHWKRTKGFMWKHGGGMERVDLFRISEADFAKWEKRCKSLKIESLTMESSGTLIGPLSNDIRNELNFQYNNISPRDSIHSVNLNVSNNVMPLQSYTNGRGQVSCPVLSGVSEAGPPLHKMLVGTHLGDAQSSQHLTGQLEFNSFTVGGTIQGFINGQTGPDVQTAHVENNSPGLLKLTPISSIPQQDTGGNVHTGAPPPWFNATEGNHLEVMLKPIHSEIGSSQAGKRSKLNPKRVGAAWAERRKIEMELERRGELVANNYSANWLPNFGRVWQSGTRKESKKEFKIENQLKEFKIEDQSSQKAECQTERILPLQPYISKRMRGALSILQTHA